MHERNEIDKIFFEQRPLLKHNLPIQTLGGPPPPKGDLVFENRSLFKEYFIYFSSFIHKHIIFMV